MGRNALVTEHRSRWYWRRRIRGDGRHGGAQGHGRFEDSMEGASESTDASCKVVEGCLAMRQTAAEQTFGYRRHNAAVVGSKRLLGTP